MSVRTVYRAILFKPICALTCALIGIGAVSYSLNDYIERQTRLSTDMLDALDGETSGSRKTLRA